MVYGYMLENKVNNVTETNKFLVESFYEKLYNQIESENSSFRNIVEALQILDKNNILLEEDQQSKDKTLLDKIKAIFKKVCLFFSKVKSEAYKKFIDLGYNRIKKLKGKYSIPDGKVEDNTDNTDDLKLLFIKKDSFDSTHAFFEAYDEIQSKLVDAYNDDNIEVLKDIDLKKLPEIKIETEEIEFTDKSSNSLYHVYDSIMIHLDLAKSEIDNNISNIENTQSFLTNKIKAKNSHNQMIVVSKMIDLFNTHIKECYMVTNAAIKCAFNNYRFLKKLYKIKDNDQK